ncbi:MAG TPA: hypothetical protein VFO69_01830 [Allosphingosinicella sp.]|nr:hypothetical protein [Allosphingosinicella sp.]
MATIAAPRARWQRDRRFFSGIALAFVAVTFIGFAPTYYLGSWMGAKPLEPLVHLHGVVFTTWILLYLVQNGLIALNRADIHRLTGTATAAFALVVVVVGVAVAIESGRLGHGPPGRHQPSFLAYPLANMLMFTIFTLLGLAYRKRSDFHKRLMFLATLGLVITPLARISRMSSLPFDPPAIGGMILADIFLAALVIFDLRTRGRLHPATLWAGGVFLASQPMRVAIGNSEPWQNFARYLIG